MRDSEAAAPTSLRRDSNVLRRLTVWTASRACANGTGHRAYSGRRVASPDHNARGAAQGRPQIGRRSPLRSVARHRRIARPLFRRRFVAMTSPTPAPGTGANDRNSTVLHATPRHSTRWRLLFAVWAISGVLSAAQSYLSYALRDEMPRNWPYVVIGFLTWLSWALLTPIVTWLARRVPLQGSRERLVRALGTHLARLGSDF